MSTNVNTELYETAGELIGELGEDHMLSQIMRNNMACGDLEGLLANIVDANTQLKDFESQNDEYDEVM